jgi:4-aminobutyrate aminotransferase-like enzyme
MIDPVRALSLTREHETGAANTFRLVPDPPVFVRGSGPWLFDAAGRRFLDLVCGSATTTLGHGHPAHREAVARAAETGIFHTGTRLPSPFRAELYERIAALMPEGLSAVHLANSGAEAIETAIKAAQFATGRRRLLAFEGGYHGRTLGALSVTSGDRIRRPFSTLDGLVDTLPYPAADDGAGPAAACVAAIAETLDRRAAAGEPVAALVLEAVQGVSGVVEPHADFIEGLRREASRAGALVVLDEIWNGFGRAGRWFGFERAGLSPDLVVMGKALSASLPLSAVAGRPEVLKAWPPGMHTSTFQGNPLACACAVATIDTIARERLVDHVAGTIEPLARDRLSPLAASDGVTAIRVVGAQAAVAFAPEDSARATRVQKAALDDGLLVYGGGRSGECVMLVPPINIGADVLDEALGRIVAIIRRTA